jgi:choline dehydrogenase-like flavoprotein
MVYNRASKEDYDRWEELGNLGWNFNALLEYFKRAKTFTPPSPEVAKWDIEYVPAYHGEHGLVQSSFSRFVWPSSRKISDINNLVTCTNSSQKTISTR